MAAPSIAIVGAGVFGLTAALALRARGWAVTVLEQGRVPHPEAASTDLSKVVRMDYGADPLYTEMGEQALAGWRRWNGRWGRELYHATGFLVMTREEEMSAEGFEGASFRTLRARGHPLRRIRRADLAREFPAWNAAGYGDGYFNPHAGWVESGAVVAALAGEARARGVVLREEAAWAGWWEARGAVVGVRLADGAGVRADRVLSAVGAWTPFLLPELRGVLRVTGQPVLHLRPERAARFAAPAFPVWAAEIARTGWYGFPATADGIVKVANHGGGVPVTHPAQARTVVEADVARCREFLRGTFPELATAPVAATRQCWYGDSVDGHFLIASHPARPGLVVAAGDSGHGFKFAPVLGELLAAAVEGRAHPWAERFGWRTVASGGAAAGRGPQAAGGSKM